MHVHVNVHVYLGLCIAKACENTLCNVIHVHYTSDICTCTLDICNMLHVQVLLYITHCPLTPLSESSPVAVVRAVAVVAVEGCEAEEEEAPSWHKDVSTAEEVVCTCALYM